MKLPFYLLKKIYIQSLSFNERLAYLQQCKFPKKLNSDNKNFDIWFEQACGCSEESFVKFCQKEKVSRDLVISCFDDRNFYTVVEIPKSFVVFNDIDFSASESVRFRAWFTAIEAKYPFQELWYPIIEACHNVLKRDITYYQLNDKSQRSLLEALLKELCAISEDLLYKRFSRCRSQESISSDFSFYLKKKSTTDTRYLNFIKQQKEIIVQTFTDYPVMFRLFACRYSYYVRHILAITKRFRRDRPNITKYFGLSSTRLTAISTGMSDSHNAGQSVALLTFDNGSKLVYKPRSLELEKIWNSLLQFCNSEYGTKLRTYEVICYKDYGWSEYVKYQPVEDDSQLENYYRSCGNMLFLLSILQASDCHFENVVVQAESPVLVDAECLFSINNEYSNSQSVFSKESWRGYNKSVLKTEFLPQKFSGIFGGTYNIGGLYHLHDQKQELARPAWLNINSDEMCPGVEKVRFPSGNMPYVTGKNLQCDSLSMVKEGFRYIYDAVNSSPSFRFFVSEIIASLSGKKSRYVPRGTYYYALMIRSSCGANKLKSWVDRSVLLEELRTPYSDKKEIDDWDLIKKEQESLYNLDIPFFRSCLTKNTVFSRQSKVLSLELYDKTIIDSVLENISCLSENDREMQIKYIDSTFLLNGRERVVKKDRVSKPGDRIFTDSIVEEQIEKNFNQLQETYLSRSSVKPESWLSLSLDIGNINDQYFLMPMGNDLFSGRCGMCVSWLAHSKVMNNAQSAQFANSTYEFVIEQHNNQSISGCELDDIGAYSGTGSLLYMIYKRASLSGDLRYLSDLQFLLSDHFHEKLRQDSSYDVIYGSAGILLVLCSIHRLAPDTRVELFIRVCVNRLVGSFKKYDKGIGWPSGYHKMPGAGLSHGNSGIAMALARYYQCFQDEAVLPIIKEALRYEKQFFSNEKSNWVHMTTANSAKPVYSNCWSHGAPGIGLARLKIAEALDGNEFRDELKIALQTACFCDLDTMQLSSGTLGVADILIEAGRCMDDVNYRQTAEKIIFSAIARKENQGYWSCLPGYQSSQFASGLLLGLPGISYALMRSLSYSDLNSVLTLE